MDREISIKEKDRKEKNKERRKRKRRKRERKKGGRRRRRGTERVERKKEEWRAIENNVNGEGGKDESRMAGASEPFERRGW